MKYAGILIVCLLSWSANQVWSQDKVTYDDHVKPMLMQRCSSCHNGQKREGDLDVTNYINLMQGGGSGTVIEPQDVSNSYLYLLVTHEESPEMPPSGTKIPDPEIALLAKWIETGALENQGSKAAKAKPKLNMELSANPSAKPEVMPLPFRISLQPEIESKRASVQAIATSPWAPIAAVATPKQILLFHTETLQLTGVIPFPEGVAHSLRFSRNGQYLLAGGGRDGASGKAVLFHARTGERVTTIGDELDTVLAADVSPNQQSVALGGPAKLVKLFAIDGALTAEIKKHTDWVTAIEFSPDGKWLATGDRSGGLHVWEAETGDPVVTLKGHTKQITALSWRSDAKFLASASEDASIRVWETEEGKQIKSWTGHGGGVTSLEFQRDGNLVSTGRDRVAKRWDQNGKMLAQYDGLSDVGVAVSHCDETDRILAADWQGQLNVWTAADKKVVGQLAANPLRLENRLTLAQSSLQQAQAAHQPLATQATQSKATVDGLNKTLADTKASSAQTQAKLAETEKQLTAATQQFQSTSAQQEQWKVSLNNSSAARPLIATSLEQSRQALAKLPSDAELKQAIGLLEQKLATVDGQIADLKQRVAKSDGEKNSAKSRMDELSSQVVQTRETMEQLNSQVKQTEGQLAAANQAFAKHQQAADAAAGVVAAAQKQISRWQGELAFIKQLAELRQLQSQAQEQVNQKQAVVDQAEQALATAQQAATAAVQGRDQASQQAAEVESRIRQLRGEK